MVMPSSRNTVATLDLEILKWAPICWVVSPAWYRWTMSSMSVGSRKRFDRGGVALDAGRWGSSLMRLRSSDHFLQRLPRFEFLPISSTFGHLSVLTRTLFAGA